MHGAVRGRRSVELGANVAPGQPLVALAESGGSWITANFKETQIEDMDPGDPADVRVDAYPGVTLHGRIESIARKYLYAVQEAGKVYRHIEQTKGAGTFVPEVSMDETDQPQTPVELLFILAAIGAERIPVQTIAPKFTGRFNKGVDYVGDVTQFAREFNDDLAVIAFGIAEFGLPANLKLSVHSGSDKFSIYPAIRAARLLPTEAIRHD